MTFEERASIKTPEGIELQLTLAGLGSRFGAAVIDSLILGILVILATFGFGALAATLADESGLLVSGLAFLVLSGIIVGYFIVFEVLNDGRTPGKAAFGLRVTSVDGQPVTFGSSMIRNLLRIVDLLPMAYLIGAVAILASDRNQRLGDLAARTLVVRTRTVAGPPIFLGGATEQDWDVSAITADEVALIRRYIERRRSLDPGRRSEVATQIAAKIRPKVTGVDPMIPDDRFLELTLATKLARGGDQSS